MSSARSAIQQSWEGGQVSNIKYFFQVFHLTSGNSGSAAASSFLNKVLDEAKAQGQRLLDPAHVLDAKS
jgi:hypothetical protein